MLPKDIRIVIFDTETTGLKDADQVIQFSAVVLNHEFKVVAMDSFYCNVKIPISQGAIDVHGINNRDLEKLSKGKYIEDYLPFLDYMNRKDNTIFVGYNVDFDIKKINHSLTNEGYDAINFGRKLQTLPTRKMSGNGYLDVMRPLCSNLGYNGNRKLNMIFNNHGPCDEERIRFIISKLAEKYNVDIKDKSGYHDSLFDTMITTSLLIKYKHFFLV